MPSPHKLALALLLVAAAVSTAATPIRIDLSATTGRSDAETPGWHEWEIKEAQEASHSFDGVTVTLRASGDGLRGFLHKAILASGPAITADGVEAHGSVEMVLEGLAAGRHAIAAYHNHPRGEPLARVWLTPADSDSPPAVEDPNSSPITGRAASDDDAGVTYLEFNAPAGGAVRLKLRSSAAGGSDKLVLNALEIDAGNPRAQASKPAPENLDEHADGDDGTVPLSWSAPSDAEHCRVYFASGLTREEAELDLAGSRCAGTSTSGTFSAQVDPNDSLRCYCWRVDVVDSKGRVTPGDVWTFRIRHLAFPGAEGYGRFARGGRGGRVIKVTTLADSGPGSLRAAIEASGPRTIVFDVGGRIELKQSLVLRDDYVTVAGQTAPGKGICISNYNFGMLGAHDNILRFLRVRPGDASGNTLDGMGMASCDHSIVDHCSISWTQDEAFSSRGAKNITLQRTLISEALNIAGHRKYKEGTQHGYAASISGDIGSFHHNLLAHCAGRNWSLAGAIDQANIHAGRLDIRNNVVYNWGYRTTDGGAKQVQFVNNYYKPGPATTVFHVLKPERNHAFGPQDYFVEGNVMEGRYGPKPPLAGVVEPHDEPLSEFVYNEPFWPSYVRTHSAREAYLDVLADVGCNVPSLDDHDRRVIAEARAGTAAFSGSQSGLPGLPDSQQDVGGWEDYPEEHRPADWDTDADGLPDAWELSHDLDPHDPADGPADSNGDGYTHLEDYLNELAATTQRR